MEKDYFWKNFNLGTELSIAGSFLYNGLKAFDCMDNFNNVDEVFEFLYNISVGVERLEKVLVILIEHNESINQEKLEKSLITHNHSALLQRIAQKYTLGLHPVHNSFIQLLTNFYMTWRYDRFNMGDAYNYSKEREALVSFLRST